MSVRDDDKLQVQQATDIVRLIGEQVALRPKGREFVGLCPFHDDKNPSMQVSPAKQIYKCFSCGAGGDVFSFAMNYHKMTFPEALKHLAERAGIELARDRDKGPSEGPGIRQQIAAANAQALAFYQRLLKHDVGQMARDYVTKRGISERMVADFALGYAPDGWDELAKTIGKRGWDLKGFELAGLVSPRKQGDGYYDRLRHRLIFPIFDAIGRPIAFGGRKLREGDEPKYLNSPETKLFNKSATLYGLHLAKKPIIDAKTAVIVEGYTDVIACHQAGLRNVVATLGTALTGEHVAELRRYAEQVVLIFDPDEAGQKAADRAVEAFLTGEVDVAIAELPGGLDPADLLAQADGVAEWKRAMGAAQDALAYQFARVQAEIHTAATVTGRQHAVEQYLQRLGQLGLAKSGSVRRAFVGQKLAELLQLDERQVQQLLRQSGQGAPRPGSRPVANAQNELSSENSVQDGFAPSQSDHRLKAIRLAECQLIGCLLRDNELFSYPLAGGRPVDEALLPGDMVTAENRKLYQRIYDRLARAEPTTLTSLLGELAASGEQTLANAVTEADAQVDAAVGKDAQADLAHVLVPAGEKILAHHREQDYANQRATLAERDIEMVQRRLREQFLRPSPVRIARPGR